MAPERANTIQRSGSRFYVRGSEKQPGVTSIIGAAEAKPFLQAWSAKMVAEYVADNLGAVLPLLMADRVSAIDVMKNAPRRYTKVAADRGTYVHELFELMTTGGKMPVRIEPEIKPFVSHMQEFLDKFQPKILAVEETLWNSTVGYAGSVDAFMEIGGEIVVLDLKTSKAVYSSTALQLAAYRFAEETISGGPVPSATAGAVLHVREEGWSLVPMKCDEEVFEVFKNMVQIFKWSTGLSRDVIGKAL